MRGRTPLQIAALLVGGVFLLVGVLGFIPGITTNFDELSFAGHDGDHGGAELLGIFQVNVLHNVVHLAFGVVGLLLARSIAGARTFLIGGGLVYLVVWLIGVMVDMDSDANFLALDTADNWLHLLLGAGMVATGVILSRPARLRTATA